MGLERAYADGCSDNSSIMRTVESLLTNAVKRFVGCICDLAENTGTKTRREGQQRLSHSKCLSPSLTGITMAQREPVMRQLSKPRKKAKPLKASERSGLFPVVTSTLLNMICVTTVFATVLALLLGVAKWT
jgi:hypothetical protein